MAARQLATTGLAPGAEPAAPPNSYITTVCINAFFFFNNCTFFSGARGSSRALGCGARRGPACTPRRKFGSRAGSVARSLGVLQSRNLASNHGVALRGARAEQDNGKPTCRLFCPTAVKGSNTVTTIASSFPRSYKLRPLYAREHHSLLCSVWS